MFEVLYALAALSTVAAGSRSPSPAGVGDTLRIADAVRIAREANPMLRAARLRADAASARILQAGALPDPELSLGLMNRMVGSLGSTTDPIDRKSTRLNSSHQ